MNTKSWVELLLLLITPTLRMGSAKYLLGTYPTGGMWGGQVDPGDGGRVEDLYQAGYAQAGIYYGAISHDPVGDKLLMEVVDTDGVFHGLSTGPVCEPNLKHRPEILLERVELVDAAHPYLTGCGADCGWSGFIFYNSQIYFLFVGQYGLYADKLRIRTELRVLDGCSDMFPILDKDPIRHRGERTPFPILRCSRLLATISDEPMSKDSGVKAGRNMAFLVDEDNNLHFFFQVALGKYLGLDEAEVTSQLYVATSKGHAQRLHQETLVVPGEAWPERSSGGIDVTDDVICWGTFHHLSCGRISGADISGVKHVLEGADSEGIGICTGIDTSITGTAIQKSGGSLYVYVSCEVAALVSLSSDLSLSDLDYLQEFDESVPAGRMILVDHLYNSCP